MENVLDSLRSMTAEEVETLHSEGVIMWQATIGPNEMLFIPTGTIDLERACSGDALYYGIRKSFFCQDEQSIKRYEKLIGLSKTSGKASERMDKVLEILNQPPPALEPSPAPSP